MRFHFHYLARGLGAPQSWATDSGRRGVPTEVFGQGPWPPEVLGQGGVCCFIIWPGPSGCPPGPWPRTPAGGSSRGPRPRTVLGPRRSLAKDLVESYGDIVQEVFGYGPFESLAKTGGIS